MFNFELVIEKNVYLFLTDGRVDIWIDVYQKFYPP